MCHVPAPQAQQPPTAAVLPTLASAVAQTELFPRKVLRLDPPQKRTADALGEAEADDNHRYVVKGDAHNRRVRASEWLCSRVAEAVGIGVPQVALLEMPDQSIVFGSRRLAGVAGEIHTQAYLLTSNYPQMAVPVVPVAYTLSAIYVFDMMIHNDDRHLGNYLAVAESGTYRLFAYDFSRALFWAWPWNGFPAAGTNTINVGRLLRSKHPFDMAAAEAVLDRLGALPPSTVERFVREMPGDWLPDPAQTEFIAWWSGPDRNARVATLRKGLKDGSLL